MRKIDPEGVWSDFEDQLGEQARFYTRSLDALTSAQDRKIATENYTLTLGVLFEGFVNDLIFAYANRDCTRVMQHLETSVRKTLESNRKAAAAFDGFAEFKSQRHLTKKELKAILDPAERNTSFPNYASIEDRANQWLIAEHARRFTGLTAQQRAIIDLTIAFRNNLAHRSKSSLDQLNDILKLGPLYPTGLCRSVNRVQQAGHYLKSQMNGGTRASVLAVLLREAAHELVR